MSKVYRAYEDNFTQVSNNVIRDKELSFKAKGIYVHLISKKDGWEYNMTEIERSSTDGKDSVRSGMKELEAAGYVERKPSQDENGKMAGWDYFIYAERRENRPTVNRHTENPPDGKYATNNTNQNNTDGSNTDESKEKTSKKEITYTKPEIVDVEVIEKSDIGEIAFEQFWNVYPSKKAKGRARVAFRLALKKTTLNSMLLALHNQKRSKKWTEENGKFIPHPATWLNGECWDDEMTMADVSSDDVMDAIMNDPRYKEL